jgi:prevent-host-death family protein
MIVNMHRAKSELSKLVEQALRGEDIVIARDGKPVARLIAIETLAEKRPIGLSDGLVKTRDNFNDPLPEGFDGLS